MADINQIVNVNITRESARITRAGFGTALILGVNAAFTERVRVYNDIKGVGVDFDPASEEYLMALSLLSQQLSPKSFLIGRRLATSAQENDVTIAGTIEDDDVFSITIGRITYSYTATGGSETVTTVATALAALVNADARVDASAVVGVITVTVTDNNDAFLITADVVSTLGTIVVADSSGTIESIAVTLDAINLEDDTYYGILATKRSNLVAQLADIQEIAVQTEARDLLFGYSTNEADAKTSADTDIFSVLQAASYNKSLGIFSSFHLNYPEAAWFGFQFPKDAGTTNWKFKTLVGTPKESLTGTEYNNLLGKNANFLQEIKGATIITSEAVVASGEYIDIIRGVDSTTAELAEDIFAYLIAKDKVPFTNAGIQAIGALVTAVLVRKARVGLYVETTIIVNTPDVADIPATEKANRQLLGITFSVQLQGAINFVEVQGTVYP